LPFAAGPFEKRSRRDGGSAMGSGAIEENCHVARCPVR
jgi:hypothetical protein